MNINEAIKLMLRGLPVNQEYHKLITKHNFGGQLSITNNIHSWSSNARTLHSSQCLITITHVHWKNTWRGTACSAHYGASPCSRLPTRRRAGAVCTRGQPPATELQLFVPSAAARPAPYRSAPPGLKDVGGDRRRRRRRWSAAAAAGPPCVRLPDSPTLADRAGASARRRNDMVL